MNRRLKFLITYGPTREPLDPVRFLSNYSTGTLGRRLVEEAEKAGHSARAVECPNEAETAIDLKRVLQKQIGRYDVLVMAAAVCDVRPVSTAKAKIKKNALSGLRLVKNPDVVASLASKKKASQVFIGFAVESNDFFSNALKKLSEKGLDAIVLQKLTGQNKPFGDKAVEAYILERTGKTRGFKAVPKKTLAKVIVREAERLFIEKSGRRSLGRGSLEEIRDAGKAFC